MKRLAFFGLIFVAAAVGVWYVFLQPTEQAADTAESTPLPQAQPVVAQDTVSAEGFVMPEHEIQVAFEIGGRLAEVLVEEGDVVEVGQVLARLESSDQRFAVAEAEAQVAIAQARLADALARPTEAAIAQREIAIDQAEAALRTALAGASGSDINEARANLAVTLAQLQEVEAGTRSEELAAAQAAVQQGEYAVQAALYSYNEVAGGTNEERIEAAGIELERATLQLEKAKANYRTKLAGYTPEELAVSRAQVGEQQAVFNQVAAAPTDEQVAVLMADIQARQADLDHLLAGTRAESVAVRRGELAEAEASLAKAMLALEDTEIVAPFTGIVTDVPVEVGQQVSPTTQMATLSTLSPWHIETDDLTELDVVYVEVGQTVNISVDALPSETFAGIVTAIKPQSETKAGDVTYEVRIEFTDSGETDNRLKWGMTTFVDILTDGS